MRATSDLWSTVSNDRKQLVAIMLMKFLTTFLWSRFPLVKLFSERARYYRHVILSQYLWSDDMAWADSDALGSKLAGAKE